MHCFALVPRGPTLLLYKQVWRGRLTGRLPAPDACDVAGIPYILPIAYIPAIENPNAYKPLHAVKTGLAEFTCLICGETKKANNQISNNSNAFTHVRKKHLEHYPINCWSLEEARELEVKWKKDLSERKRWSA